MRLMQAAILDSFRCVKPFCDWEDLPANDQFA
jgi:hypothetical protein